MGSKDHCGAFGSDLLFNGVVAVPKLLLHNYARLELREVEVILILQIISLREKKPYPTAVELAELMGINPVQVEAMLEKLIQQNILSIEKVYDSGCQMLAAVYSLHGLMEKLSELWAMDKHHQHERTRSLENQIVSMKILDSELTPGPNNKVQPHSFNKSSSDIQILINSFEKGLGRLLTQHECANIIEWHEGCGFPLEVLTEALNRAVINQTTTWKYINSILREWHKKNLKTLQDILEDDARFHARQEKTKISKTKSQPGRALASQDKFKDFSL